MIIYAGAAFLVIGFVVLMKLFGLAAKSLEVIAVAKQAYGDLTNAALSDDDKEARMRARTKTLGGLFVVVTLGAAAAVSAPVLAIWLLDTVGVLSFDLVMNAAISWQFILLGAVLAGAVIWFDNRRHHGV